MPPSSATRARRNRAVIVAGSAAGHLLVLVLIGLNAPGVRRMVVDEAREPPVVTIELFSPPPPPREARSEAAPVASPLPQPVRPRPVAPQAPPAEIAPLPLPPVPKPAPPAPTPAPVTGGGSGVATTTPFPDGALRNALRRSSVGCANGDTVGLNRREKEGCDERFGKDAKDAPFIPAPIARAKREAFDAAAAAKDRKREWRAAPVPVGIDPRANAGGGSPAGLDDNR